MHTLVRPRLRPWRRGFALKQKEIASLLGIKSTTHVSRIENGHRAPSLEIAIAFELLTGERICFLFPHKFKEVESKTIRRVERLRDRLEAVESMSAQRKRELLIDVLDRVTERNPSTLHVE